METEASGIAGDLDPRRTAIWQLQQTLTGHALIAELAESEPLLVVAGNREDGFRSLTVRCDARGSDGGALWFLLDADEPVPLAPVGRTIDAVTAILGERILRV